MSATTLKTPQNMARARELRAQGMILRDIAADIGVARPTVHQWLTDPDGVKTRARRARYGGQCADCGAPTDGSNGSARAPKRCAACSWRWQATLEFQLAQSARASRRTVWSDEQILDAIRSVADPGGRVTVTMYQAAYAAAPKGAMPSFRTIAPLRWRLWADAATAAGCHANRRLGPYSTSLTGEGALLALRECARALGKPPSSREYTRWAAANGAPSGPTIRAVMGTWGNALRALTGATP